MTKAQAAGWAVALAMMLCACPDESWKGTVQACSGIRPDQDVALVMHPPGLPEPSGEFSQVRPLSGNRLSTPVEDATASPSQLVFTARFDDVGERWVADLSTESFSRVTGPVDITLTVLGVGATERCRMDLERE